MIAKLFGRIDSVGDDWVVLDVGGVGYLVSCSARTLSRLPKIGEMAHLLIDMHVRQDAIILYGFIESTERMWFRLLLTVQGVGSRVALAILSALSPEELSRSLSSGDKTMLCRASGVGAKLAQRLVTELRDKAATVPLTGRTTDVAGAAPLESGPLEDAISALVNLGYRRIEAHAAVIHASGQLGERARINELINAGLKYLGKDLLR